MNQYYGVDKYGRNKAYRCSKCRHKCRTYKGHKSFGGIRY